MAVNIRSNIASQETVAVFDLCDTLYFSNTTHDFVRFVVGSEGLLRRTFYQTLNSKYLPARYFFIGLSVWGGWDLLRTLNISLLKNRTQSELSALGKRFVDEFLKDRKVAGVHALLEACRERGQHIILCSSSIEPVVASVAERLGFDSYVSTTLEYENGIFTGRIERNVSNKKLQDLKEEGLECGIDLAVSDNAGDLDLLKTARRSYAVVHSRRKEEFWKKYEIEILYPTR
jgi:HAD superfamily phosphoserine phosphatase-like hydrolase